MSAHKSQHTALPNGFWQVQMPHGADVSIYTSRRLLFFSVSKVIRSMSDNFEESSS
jgi:hypothetical protein